MKKKKKAKNLLKKSLNSYKDYSNIYEQQWQIIWLNFKKI